MDEQARALAYAQAAGRMLQLPTVYERDKPLPEAFGQFYRLLEELFPQVHRCCRRLDFDGSFLFEWQGRTPGEALVLMSHHDVVAAPGEWKVPPFSGLVQDGKLWGRGALDVKGNLFCMLQAMEELLAGGYVPEHTVYLVSSCMEEVGGNDKIADYFAREKVAIGLLLDEGTPILEQPLPGLAGKWALVSVAEKGYMDVRFVARSAGGHSMAPPKNGPLPRLGAFMAACEKHPVFRPAASPACREMLHRAAKGFSGWKKLACKWPGGPWLEALLGPIQRLTAQTSMAFTMAQGSQATNVLPTEASVVANLRLAPQDTPEWCMEQLQQAAAPYGLEAVCLKSVAPSPVADCTGPGFALVERAVKRALPGVGVLPFVLSGGTDTKHFHGVCGCCLRFTPLLVTTAQQATVHGKDENIDYAALPGAVDFFKALIREQGGAQ